MNDPFELERFIEAQTSVFEEVCSELRNGLKTGHWMWFIFPQIEGLGHSHVAKKFAIPSLEEARAYFRHPILGPRLIECAELIRNIEGRTVDEILGYPDNLKLRSSMTLFARTAPECEIFEEVLVKYYMGENDPITLQRLGVIET